MARYEDLTGRKFSKLTVISKTKKPEGNKSNYSWWLCQCECGNKKIVPSQSLKNNHTRSCGCLLDDRIRKLTLHNMSKTKIYGRWNEMKERCSNPKDISYKNYGARGIKVCDEWKKDFILFYEWAIKNGYAEDLEIDRINSNGNYEPSNCRWVSKKKNARNKRNNRLITINGIEKTMAEWAEISGISIATMYARLKYGIKGEDLLKPLRKKHK